MAEKHMNWTSGAARRLRSLAGTPRSMEQAISIIVSRLLQGVSCPPTDLEAIMPRLNVACCEVDADLPISGELRKDTDGLKIVLSAHLSATRRRWTIAHELGHAVFETTGPNCPRYGKELERLCEMIAREMLLPKARFLPLLEQGIDLERISNLANIFKTSLAATAIRCAELTGVSVFEMECKRLIWGYGVVSKGRRTGKDDEFRAAVDRAMRGESGHKVVVLTTTNQSSRWLMEWKCLGRGQRALFLLQRDGIQSKERPSSYS